MADAAVTAPQHQHAHQHQHHRPTSQGPSSSSTKLDSTASSSLKTAAPETQSRTHFLSPRDDAIKSSSPAPISSTAPFGQNLKATGTSSSHTNDSSRRIAEMSTATVATAAPSASAVPKQFSADNRDFNTSHQAPSPASADSRHPSQSEAGPPSVFTVIDNDSVATHGTTPSPTTGRKLDLPPVVRKALPSASPDAEEKAHLSGHAEQSETTGKEAKAVPERGQEGSTQLASVTEEPREAHDEIVVSAGSVDMTPSSRATPAEAEDEAMPDVNDEDDEPIVSHYPKRKRTSVFQDLSEDKLENTKAGRDDTPLTPTIAEAETKPLRQTVGNSKGVLLGYWRDSGVPDPEGKHAVIGFIDVRDRLRTRIQTVDRYSRSIAEQYALGPGPGNCWVTFDKVAYNEHLQGLDTYAVKEYVRIREGHDQTRESDDERAENEKVAAEVAWDRAKAYYGIENRDELPVKPSQIAYGADAPELHQVQARGESKRRRTSGFFTAVNSERPGSPTGDSPTPQHAVQTLDPLEGTRPTSIQIGHWKKSTVNGRPCDPEHSHAVYGILGMNDMFRVKLIRQTKSGEYFEGNFPAGAGALWIAYEDVQLDDHLGDMTRNDVKEYCRVRQSQIDKGEKESEVAENQVIAAREARSRAAIMYASRPLVPAGHMRAGTEGYDSHPASPAELRQSGRTALRRESRAARHEHEVSHTPRRPLPSDDAIERSNAMAEHELSKAEAAQARTSRYALNRERAAAAAAEETEHAANAATAAASGLAAPSRQQQHATERPRFSMSENAQRLNNVWASQEHERARVSGDDNVKIYDGVKFERKNTGPFYGKLASPGTLITIDGEDFVEYRVLTRPSFY